MFGRLPRDEGFTLIEVLIALVVAGIAVVAFMTGLATTTKSAGVHKDEADANTYLVAAAERVKLAPYDTTCGANPYATSIAVLPASWTSRGASLSESITYWDWAQGKYTSTCVDSDTTVPSAQKMQLVRLSLVGPRGVVTDTLSVVKRYPS